jgi:putative glutamine amidotransferase
MIVGIPVCLATTNRMPFHRTAARYAEAVLNAIGALPVLIPPLGERMLGLLDSIDGLLIPGSPSNVHPDHYEGGESETPDFHDLERDHTTLPLIRAAIARGIPVLAICRGIQELNVALGGTLHQRLSDLPGRLNHAAPQTDDLALKFAKSHAVKLTEGGLLHQLAGTRDIMVNSLHNQGIDRLAPGLAIDAQAPDGTIEAVRLIHARGWALGVQWHPECDCTTDPVSASIFTAFGRALRNRTAPALELAAD